jgi:hypothetical protein
MLELLYRQAASGSREEREMNEDCEKCPLKERVTKLENKVEDLELQGVRIEERVITIFKTLTEIKELIKSLNVDVAYIKNKPARAYEKLTYEVIKTMVIAAVAFAAAKIF